MSDDLAIEPTTTAHIAELAVLLHDERGYRRRNPLWQGLRNAGSAATAGAFALPLGAKGDLIFKLCWWP
jgi:hypothetical protein